MSPLALPVPHSFLSPIPSAAIFSPYNQGISSTSSLEKCSNPSQPCYGLSDGISAACFLYMRQEILILSNRAQCSHKLALPKGCEHLDAWAFPTREEQPLFSRQIPCGHGVREGPSCPGRQPHPAIPCENGQRAEARKREQTQFFIRSIFKNSSTESPASLVIALKVPL